MKKLLYILFPVLLLAMTPAPHPTAGTPLVPKTLFRNNGERFNYYDQDPADGSMHPLVIWLHGAGEVGLANDTTTSAGLRKLLNAGTGPTALLASQFMPAYVNPSTGASEKWRYWAPQLPSNYTNWPNWIDSALVAKAKTDALIDTDRIALMGHSLGAFGTWTVAGDTLLALQHSFFCMSSTGGWPSTLTYSGNPGYIAARSTPPILTFHSANDPTAAVSNTKGLVGGLYGASTSPGRKGPLWSITYIEFSGATPSSSGHNIQMTIFALNSSATQHALSNGSVYVFTMPVWQIALKYTKSRKPTNY